MSYNTDLVSLLTETGLTESGAPNAKAWLNFLNLINERFEKSQTEKKEMQIVLDLGYQEMQKIWEIIQEREALIKVIFDSSQDIILTLNEEAQIIEFNQSAEKIFNVNKEDMAGQSIFKILRGGSLLDKLKINLSSDEKQIEPNFFGRTHEESLLLENGQEIPISIFPSRVVTSQSTIYPLYLRDLSAQKEAERELEESRSQIVLASKMSDLGQMAGGVAHEINTPLAVIQLRTDQLLDAAKEEEIDKEMLLKAAQQIDKTVKRIAKIINGLRSFARDGSKDPMLPNSLSKIVEETFGLCKERFYHQEVSLEFTADHDTLVNCRPTEIAQVVLNLLNNSFDAIQEKKDKWIRVELKTLSDHVELSVTDCGDGIPKDIQEKIMKPFFTTKETGKGTGLGLSISQGIVRSHGGKMVIDNSCANTRFVISLPLGGAAGQG